VFPLLPAQDLDHLTYRALGHELPFFDVVPLSKFVHRKLVTPGRRIFGYGPVNTILRLAFGAWCALDAALVYDAWQLLRRLL
jgi:hypothetical protein